MSPFRVKICGLTRPADVRAAQRHGADLIGFIFYRHSPRYVKPGTAASLAREASPVIDRVGVFVDATYDEAMRTAEEVGLHWVQLHRSNSKQLIGRLQKQGLRVIKAFHVRRRSDYTPLYESAADLVMLDNATADRPGGTGQTFDWSVRPPRRIGNLMLAGGINAENVEEGIAEFRPLVIDVNSGVETSPGRKSSRKVKAFMQRCFELRCRSLS